MVPNARRPYSGAMGIPLFELNPALDLATYARTFAAAGRLQIRDFLTDQTAHELRNILANHTPWGAALQAGAAAKAQSWRAHQLREPQVMEVVKRELPTTDAAAARGDYAFRFMRYSLAEAYLGKWNPGGPLDLLLEHLNDEPFLQAMRQVCGMPELYKADGHATCYGPQHFLGKHLDSHVAEGWKVAYVLNLTIDDWHPDWGGYLQFFDDDGDVEVAFKPRFNSLNLFAVPRAHSVSYVPPFAPMGRYTVSGWLRDR